jgi:hypothetical protein
MGKHEIERLGESVGHCDCCGNDTHSISGLINEADSTLAAYSVRWTDGHLAESGADIQLIIGPWGDGTADSDRFVVLLQHKESLDGSRSVMVIDATPCPGLAEHAMLRDDVIGTPLAAQVFELIDAIYLQDERMF